MLLQCAKRTSQQSGIDPGLDTFYTAECKPGSRRQGSAAGKSGLDKKTARICQDAELRAS
jgi:hypothetical protein